MRDGFILDFHPDPWMLISKKARWSIRKALKQEVYTRDGSLDELKDLHWNPSYLPFKQGENQLIYCAEIYEDRPISAVMVEVEDNHLIYKYSGNNKDHLDCQGNSLLLWYVYEKHKDTHKYLDLGGSRQHRIERFKRQFSTRTYQKYNPRTIMKRIKYRVHQAEYLIRESLK